MKLERTNLQTKLEKVRNKEVSEAELLEQIRAVFDSEEEREQEILERIQEGGSGENNAFNFDLLETNRIFHISHIKKTCIQYRLRFLDSKYFKAELPQEALFEIKRLEKEHDIILQGFKIMAPAKLFKLKNADDPILFAPIGNDYFYLIKKWGNDLQPLRKLFMWPFKNLETLLASSFLGCFFLTFAIREVFFAQYRSDSQFFMIYFFTFKSVAALLLFYGVALGKNFSSSVWRSKYYNA